MALPLLFLSLYVLQKIFFGLVWFCLFGTSRQVKRTLTCGSPFSYVTYLLIHL